MALSLYNTLTRTKEIFVPINPDKVGLYVCGPTVYDRAHLGNARPVVVFDVLYRLLKSQYPNVCYVRNITDIDDKINAAAKANGEPISSLTARTIVAYHEDMAALGALPPDIEPHATAHIDQMIAMISQLIDKGHAYESLGHVLFSVNSFDEYGQLSRRQQEELIAGARVEIAPYKRDPGDFVLWKPSDADLPGWDSPWGRGRPGWHIECSAMSGEYLGPVFDIHAGGIDLIFPHHENEVAQSRCAHGTDKLANYWLHNGHLTITGTKMSKSLGNFFTVRQLLETASGEVIRAALLSTHYRQPLDWTDDTLPQAKQMLDRLYTALRQVDCGDEKGEPESEFLKALEDDINTPQALAYLHDVATRLNKETDLAQKRALAACLRSAGALLGLLQQDPEEWFKSANSSSLSSAEIEDLIAKRKQARLDKDFKTSDLIRDQLLEKGVILEDGAGGTTWRYI